MALPERIDPMLAKLGSAFDSDQHVFEVKWDGFRTLVFRNGDGLRLQSRNGIDLLPRFPEMESLRALPEGSVVDGELIILSDGTPDFHKLLARERGRLPGASLADGIEPATFIAFDLLYEDRESLLDLQLVQRLRRLTDFLQPVDDVPLVQAEGVIGSGLEFFAQACDNDLEGVIAKRLDSRYIPGKRSEAWIKFKKRNNLPCLIIGYTINEPSDLKSLMVAAQIDGELKYVGRVGSGLGAALRRQLLDQLEPLRRSEPFVPCDDADGCWVEPTLFCTVSYVEFTPGGNLRAPVFEGLSG